MGVVAVTLAVLPAGCSAGTTTPSPTVTQSVAPSIPADGVTLKALGFQHGPLETFSIPTTSVLVTRIDQINVVTLIFDRPDSAELMQYFATALPAAGFTITAQADDALTFEDAGWTGSFITGDQSAVTLRRR